MPERIASKEVSRSNIARQILLFLIWPAVGALHAFFSLKRTTSQIVLIAFSALVGYRFIASDERYDSFRLAHFAEDMSKLDWHSFYGWAKVNCFVTESCIDPVQPALTFLLTRLSDTYSLAFAGYGAIFAFFCFRTLALVREDFNGKSAIFCWLVLIAVLVLNPIYNISGFRFNTAIWVFLFGAYQVSLRGQKAGFVWMMLAVAFHYAMIVPLVISSLIFVLRPSAQIATASALASFFFVLPVEWISRVLSFDASLGALDRGRRYIGEEHVYAVAQQHAESLTSNYFFTVYQQTPLKAALFLIFAYLLVTSQRRKCFLVERAGRFFCYATMFFALANVFSSIPSMGRFTVMGIMAVLIALIVMAGSFSRREKLSFLIVIVPSVVWWLAAPVRRALASLDVLVALPSPFLLFERMPVL